MKIDSLQKATALRVFVYDEHLGEGVSELMEKCKEIKLTPHAMCFSFGEGEWEIILWGEE